GVGATAAALVDLSTVAGNKISNPPWVKFQSAGWVNFPSAPTAMTKWWRNLSVRKTLFGIGLDQFCCGRLGGGAVAFGAEPGPSLCCCGALLASLGLPTAIANPRS
ncbi:hypothetical protein ABZR78_31320, partial [Pseudomonas aeruginosa]